jgi:putative copper export protein
LSAGKQENAMYSLLLLLHILAATIWTGGHIVLSAVVLPRVLKERSPSLLLEFESRYERIGIPALIVQVATGVAMASHVLGDSGRWFSFADPVSALVSTKLILLAVTAAFAVDARLRIIPNLREDTLVSLAWHIIPVTLISVAFVVVGVSFRTGWFY